MKLQKMLLWLCVFILFVELNITLSDFKWVIHNTKNWEITVTYNWESITLADKNVWATKLWYWKDASSDSYWLYYQWWWMTGYKYSWTADEVKEYWFEIDIGAYFPRVEWWTLSQQIELCGEGYHIPTRTDWENIIKMFENNWNDESDFAEAFKIPFAWVRVSWSAAMLWVGKEWDLWTNSFSYTNFARSFRADDYFSDVGGSTVFVEWYPIRCFKDINSSNSDVVANLNSGDEMVDAYEFAYRNGITSIDNIANAKMDGNLTRIAMAKMLSQYAINVLWKSPDTSKVMNFRDVSFSLDKEYNYWVTLAYQLWIMWIWVN